jgi:uncharacterized protein YeaO (DUF488 family)
LTRRPSRVDTRDIVLKTKCVETQSAPGDGLRLLVTRFRGRGLPASRYDVWMPNLAPSEELLRAAQGGVIRWSEFARRYRQELFAPGAVDARNRTIRNRGQLHALRLVKHLARAGDVTLLCHCAEDAKQCHRHLLRELLASPRV